MTATTNDIEHSETAAAGCVWAWALVLPACIVSSGRTGRPDMPPQPPCTVWVSGITPLRQGWAGIDGKRRHLAASQQLNRGNDVPGSWATARNGVLWDAGSQSRRPRIKASELEMLQVACPFLAKTIRVGASATYLQAWRA